MSTHSKTVPLFHVHVDIQISAGPERVYRMVSDLPRSGEWSAECIGGRWVSGVPGAVGSVFRGKNYRSAETVEWAPVVRGNWYTEAEIITANPEREFRWAMRNSAGQAQESVWSYEIEPTAGGCILVHSFVMTSPTEGIQKITAGMAASDRDAFISEWGEKLRSDMTATVARIKQAIDAAPTSGSAAK